MPSTVNSNHALKPALADLLSQFALRDAEDRKRSAALAALLRPSIVERDLRRAASRRLFATLQGEDGPNLQQIRDLMLDRRKRFSDIIDLERRGPRWPDIEPDVPAVPMPQDHQFWWAQTDWYPAQRYKWGEYSFDGDYRNGTVVLSGWHSRQDGDLIADSFGASASFELQANRRPATPTGLLRSAPVVRVNGAISGHSDSFDAWHFWEGDKWSKCWMVTRQRLFQYGLGGPVILGESSETRTLFDRENKGGTETYALPGLLALPVLDFRVRAVEESVWASLEVRFDYQLEGDASSISFYDQPVQIAFEQWSPTAV